MKKLIILFLAITFSGCASRKVAIVKEDAKITIDSTSITKIDSSSITNKNIKYTETYSELEIKPLNDSLPIVIDGTTYFNVVLKYKKQNKVLVDTSTKKVSKKAFKQVNKQKKEIKINKAKNVDKKANYFVYFWLLLIPIGMYIYRQIKNKLFL